MLELTQLQQKLSEAKKAIEYTYAINDEEEDCFNVHTAPLDTAPTTELDAMEFE